MVDIELVKLQCFLQKKKKSTLNLMFATCFITVLDHFSIFHYCVPLWVSEGPSVGTQPKTSEFNNSEIRHIVLLCVCFFVFCCCFFFTKILFI